MRRKTIIVILSIFFFVCIGIQFFCDDFELYEAIKNIRMPLQKIANVQAKNINQLLVELDYELNGEGIDNLSNFAIINENGEEVLVHTAILDETDNKFLTIQTDFLDDNSSYNLILFNLISIHTKALPANGISFNFITPDFQDNESPTLLSYCIKSDEDYCYSYDTQWENAVSNPVYPVYAIEFAFDEPMDPVTVQSAFSLEVNSVAVAIPDGEWQDFSKIVQFSFTDLRIRSKCQINLTEDAKDSRGNALSNPITAESDIYFYTGDPDGADDFEPDDTFGEATLIDVGTTYMGKIHEQNDEDYYKIVLKSDKLYFLSLDNIPEEANYRMELYFAPDFGSQETNLIPYPVDYKKYLFDPSISGSHLYYIRLYSDDGFSTKDFYNLLVIEYNIDYGIFFNTTIINPVNQDSVLIEITGANDTDTYSFEIVSFGTSGGSKNSETFSGTVGDGSVVIDVSDIYDGTLNIWDFTLTDTGNFTTDPQIGINTAIKDTIAPAGYGISFSDPYTNSSNETSLLLEMFGGISTDEYSFRISSSGGGNQLYSGTYGSGSISVDVSGLSDGNLSITNFTLTDLVGNIGEEKSGSNNIIKDIVTPTGYSVSIDQSIINISTGTNISFTFSGAEIGTTYQYNIDDTNGITLPITGSGTVLASNQTITPINVSFLDDDTLTLTVNLTDSADNTGDDVFDTIVKDMVAPSGYDISFSDPYVNSANETSLPLSMSGGISTDEYSFRIYSSGGGNQLYTGTYGTGSITVDVSGLSDGNLSITNFTLTDNAGNTGIEESGSNTILKDIVTPTGYSISIDQSIINSTNVTSASFTFSGAEVDTTYQYSIDDTNGLTTAITGSGTVIASNQTITPINVSSLDDDTLTFTVNLTDSAANTGDDVFDTVDKDTVCPTNGSWTASGVINPGANITTTFYEAMNQSSVENTSNYTIGTSGVSIDNVVYNPVGYEATFTISYTGYYIPQNYTITPTSSIVDTSGNPLTASKSEAYTAYWLGEAGGIVFYYDEADAFPGWEYLEAAPQSTEFSNRYWGCGGLDINGDNNTVPPELHGIGNGQANTTAIVNECGTPNIAARECDNLTVNYESTDYTDWFLPSRNELSQMYTNLKAKGLGGFSDSQYWCSTEMNADVAYSVNFATGGLSGGNKSGANFKVRAIRAF